ncbi:MAG: hypothetical protein ACI4GD_03115 [Lachnospiraceae bacterium]
MKICPICDNKIQGTWCPRCFRFVTPWELKNDIYINESHHPSHDFGCEYHNPKSQDDRQEYLKQGYERMVYGGVNATTSPQQKANASNNTGNRNNTANRNNTGAKEKKKGAKAAVIIVIIYIAFFLLSLFAELIPEIIDNLKNDGDNADFTEIIKQFTDDDDEYVPEDYSVGADHSEKDVLFDYMSSIEPVISDTIGENGYANYYDPDDLTELPYVNCDEDHFEMDFNSVSSRLNGIVEDWIEYSDAYMNYVYTGKNYTNIYLSTDYNASIGNTNLCVRADTATGMIHDIDLITITVDDTYYETAYVMCDIMMPGVFNSADEIKSYVSQITSSTTEEFGDVSLYCFVVNDYVSMRLSPVAEY